MKRGIRMILPLLALCAVTVACKGWTSGSVTGEAMVCSQQGSAGRCEGSFSTLTGDYKKNIESLAGDPAQVEFHVSVQSGTVQISVESPDGRLSSVQASPSNPAILRGAAKVSSGELEMRFKALGGEATGVKFTLSYRLG